MTTDDSKFLADLEKDNLDSAPRIRRLLAMVKERDAEIARLTAPEFQYAGGPIPRAAIICRNEKIASLRKMVEVTREFCKRECLCHELHPDFGGKCGSCVNLAELDRLERGG